MIEFLVSTGDVFINFNALVQGESLNSWLRSVSSINWNIALSYMYWYEKYVDILNGSKHGWRVR